MSLIALAERVRGPRTLTRTVLLLVALTAAVIVGLLAMHALNSHTTAPAHPLTATAAEHDGHPAHTHHAESAPAADVGCLDCGEHNTMMAMICVLALLVSVLVLARPTHAGDGGIRLSRISLPTLPVPGDAGPRPPSLNVLCISRT